MLTHAFPSLCRFSPYLWARVSCNSSLIMLTSWGSSWPRQLRPGIIDKLPKQCNTNLIVRAKINFTEKCNIKTLLRGPSNFSHFLLLLRKQIFQQNHFSLFIRGQEEGHLPSLPSLPSLLFLPLPLSLPISHPVSSFSSPVSPILLPHHTHSQLSEAVYGIYYYNTCMYGGV